MPLVVDGHGVVCERSARVVLRGGGREGAAHGRHRRAAASALRAHLLQRKWEHSTFLMEDDVRPRME